MTDTPGNHDPIDPTNQGDYMAKYRDFIRTANERFGFTPPWREVPYPRRERVKDARRRLIRGFEEARYTLWEARDELTVAFRDAWAILHQQTRRESSGMVEAWNEPNIIGRGGNLDESYVSDLAAYAKEHFDAEPLIQVEFIPYEEWHENRQPPPGSGERDT